MKGRFQAGAAAVQEVTGALDSPYMTSEECWRYLKFPSIRAFYKFIESPIGHSLPRSRCGERKLLFDRRLVDLWVREGGSQQRVARRFHARSMRKVGDQEKSRSLDGE